MSDEGSTLSRRDFVRGGTLLAGAAVLMPAGSASAGSSQMALRNYVAQDATGLAALVRRRVVSAAELLELAIARAEAVNPEIDAVCLKHYAEARAALKTIDDSPWAIQLEVSYIPKDALRRFYPANNRHPHIDRGPGEHLHMMQHDPDWIVQRYILRERGITVTGPDPKTLIDPVSPADLRWAVSEILQNWFRHFLDDPAPLKSRGYLSYTVLTMCRILYTYEHGEIISKPAAAAWAKQNLDHEWIGLIERAWTGRQMPGLEALPEDINGTLDFIRYYPA